MSSVMQHMQNSSAKQPQFSGRDHDVIGSVIDEQLTHPVSLVGRTYDVYKYIGMVEYNLPVMLAP
jgi:hypothetical protein